MSIIADLPGDATDQDEAEAEGFTDLFLEEYPKVVRIAQSVLGSSSEAEDVAQDVFLALHRRWSDGLPNHPGPWLYRVTVNTALNRLRAQHRRRRHERAAERLDAPGPPSDPSELVVSGETRRDVGRALARLPKKKAAVLHLRYGGLSYSETAEALGVRVDQVGTLLRRAEAALRKEINRETPE